MKISKIRENGLNAVQIKTIAIIAMLIDHIAWSFVGTYTAAGQIMHIIGRLTAPIMCFFIAQGYLHTRSFKKYLFRMILFALISHIPYVLESEGRVALFPFSVMYTLTLGLCAIYAYDRIKNKFFKWLVIILIGIISLPGDWMFFGIAFCLIFYINRDSFKKQCIGILTVGIIEMFLLVISYKVMNHSNIISTLLNNLFQMSILLSLPILRLYNGEKGGRNQLTRWGFYIFYPLHLFILGLIKILL